MKFTLLLILGYFYVDPVTLSSAASLKNDENGLTEFQDQHKTGLDDLSVELQLKMLENLNLFQLLKMSSTNEYYRQLGADVFRRKIGAKTVVFHIRGLYEEERFKIAMINYTEKSIYIEDHDVLLTTLKNFGHLLTTLHLHFGYVSDGERRKQMVQYANEYCSETLLQLDISDYITFKLDYFSLPFKKVEKLSGFFIKFETHKNLTLDQLFPALRHLKIDRVSINQTSVSGGNILNLEYLSIISNNPEALGVKTLILKSPNLQSLQVTYCPYEFLSFVNENVPQLVELELLETRFTNQTYLDDVEYHFKNVKKLFIKTIKCDPPKKFIFDKLEYFRIDGGVYFNNEWLKFTVKNKNLKQFEFVRGWLDNRKLSIIADNLRNLEDATIKCDRTVQTGTINRFAHNNDKLKRLKVLVEPTMSSAVQTSLRTEWNLIQELDRSQWIAELYFEKKE